MANGPSTIPVGFNLERIAPLAGRLGVTVCMELPNSKVDDKDYMCDHTAWGAELVMRVGRTW